MTTPSWFKFTVPVAISLLAFALTLLAPPAVAATVWDASALAQMPAGSSSHVYPAGDGSGLALTVSQDDVSEGSMTGSDQPGYEGLWLGSDQRSYHYIFSFSQAVTRVSFSFLALSTVDGSAETLHSFDFQAGAPVTIAFSSPDVSAAWAGGAVQPLDEDSRGALSFSEGGGTLLSFSFVHNQPLALNGFVIDRIEAEIASPVPEAPSAALLLVGVLLLGGTKLFRGATRRPLTP